MSTDQPLPLEELSDRGFAYLSIHEYDEALKIANELEERRFSAAYDIAAQAHAGLGDVPEAIKTLERGVAAATKAWPNWQLLGNYLSDEERFDEAHAAYESAMMCPGVWADSVRLNQAVLAGRKKDFEAMLEILDGVKDEECLLTANEHRIHGLEALGRVAEAEKLALGTLTGPFDPETEGPTKARIAARVGSMRLAGGVPDDEVRNYAHQNLAFDSTNPAILALVRKLDGESSPDSHYYRMMIAARIPSTDPRRERGPMFQVTYDLVVDSPQEGLRYVRYFEEFFEEGDAEWEINEAVDLEARPDVPKGVYWRSGRNWAEDQESCEGKTPG